MTFYRPPLPCSAVMDPDMTWLETVPLSDLMAQAAQKRDDAFGRNISYSRKVFIPLTKLCRDVCHYCTFAERPKIRPRRVSVGRRSAGHRPRR